MGFWSKIKKCANWVGEKLSPKMEEGSLGQSFRNIACQILGTYDDVVNTGNSDMQPPTASSQGGQGADLEKTGSDPDSGPFHTREEDSALSEISFTYEGDTGPASQLMGQGIVSELAQPVALAVRGIVESGIESSQQGRAESYIKDTSDLNSYLKPEEIKAQGRNEAEVRVELVGELRRRRTIVE
jgi:hypothetical protein